MLTRRLARTCAPGRIPCTIAPMALEVTAERQHADSVWTPPGGPSNG